VKGEKIGKRLDSESISNRKREGIPKGKNEKIKEPSREGKKSPGNLKIAITNERKRKRQGVDKSERKSHRAPSRN